MMKGNRETCLVLKDYQKYLSNMNQKQTIDTHEQTLKKLKIKERRRNCLKKKTEDALKLKIQSHEKMIRDKITNYVRKM